MLSKHVVFAYRITEGRSIPVRNSSPAPNDSQDAARQDAAKAAHQEAVKQFHRCFASQMAAETALEEFQYVFLPDKEKIRETLSQGMTYDQLNTEKAIQAATQAATNLSVSLTLAFPHFAQT